MRDGLYGVFRFLSRQVTATPARGLKRHSRVLNPGFICSRVCLTLFLFCSTPALADGRAFPPDDCSAATPFMAFDGVAASGNTYCRSGQDVMRNAIPTCQTDQTVAYNGTSFYCKEGGGVTQQTVMTCVAGGGGESITTCTTAPCPTGYVRSGCSASHDISELYATAAASPAGTDRCACINKGSGLATCYTYCVK